MEILSRRCTPHLIQVATFSAIGRRGNERLSDVGGRSVTAVTVSITEATTYTAHYFLSTEDTDGDGVMDWFEYRNFGDLSFNSTDDSDGDGFSNGQEDRLGQEPTIKDQMEDGGISSQSFHGGLFSQILPWFIIRYRVIHWVLLPERLPMSKSMHPYLPNLQGAIQWLSFCILVCKWGDDRQIIPA